MPSAAVAELAGGAVDPLVWDKEKTSVLIDLWCERPVLYDFTCEEYKDRVRRRAAVLEIATELKAEEHEVAKKMKNLRRQYSRERSLTEAAKAASAITGEEPSFASNWYYYRKMSFLDLFMNAKPSGAAAKAVEPHQESIASDSSDSRHDDGNQFSSSRAGDWVADHSVVGAVENNGDMQHTGVGLGTCEDDHFTLQHSPSECVMSCSIGEGGAGHHADAERDIGRESLDPCSMEQQYRRGPHQKGVYSQVNDESGKIVGALESIESYSTTRSLTQGSSATMPTEPGIRRAPISSINVMKRLKRKRPRGASAELPPPTGRIRVAGADAESRLSSSAPPREQLPSGVTARSGSDFWDSDDIFGKFVADELRQITDIRAKRLTKFKMHAALLEAHHESPRTPASQWDPA